MRHSLNALAVLLLPCATLAAPVPEPFVSGWGNPVDPDRDCKIQREKGALIIEIPGTVHEYNFRRKLLNAPRLLREIEGDFEVEVRIRIDCRPSAQSSVKDLPSYVSAGFLITPPESFGICFWSSQYRVGGQGDEAEGCAAMLDQALVSGETNGVMPLKNSNGPFKSKPDYVYLRLARRGELLGIDISPDHKKWLAAGGGLKVGLPSKLKVGLFACTTSTDPSKVIFDQLRITFGQKKTQPYEFVSGWGAPIDPDKDCKIQRDKDSLAIDMPGVDHDYDPVRERFNAPRLLSDLEGEFDLQVRIRIDSRPSARSTVEDAPPFISAGFLLIYPEKDHSVCARLEYAVAQPGSRLAPWVGPRLAEPQRKDLAPKGKETESYVVEKNWTRWTGRQRKGNGNEQDQGRPRPARNIMWERSWPKWPLPEKADYAYLRLNHRSGWSSVYISPDGEKWTLLNHVPSVPEKGKIGLAAYSTSTEPSKVRFDQLKLWRYKKKER